MVPADKKIYALRDASGTVPSIPLITASILSKKLAESLDALILDVKFGCAAFMQTKADARKLAKAMVALGNECGTNTRAILTDMNTPLGRAAGNWLEVKESVAVLEPVGDRAGTAKAKWKAEVTCGRNSDLRSLVLDCAAHLLVQTRQIKIARRRAQAGGRLPEFRRAAQKMGRNARRPRRGFESVQPETCARFHRPVVVEVKSEKSGYVSKCDARIIGEVIRDLGGGRLTKESAINYDVGVDQIAKPGERVEKSGVLCRVHAASQPEAKLPLRG